MSTSTETETLFQQFCRTRDPAVLGEVFDRCADDLFAVALHLAIDRAAAEDLVQSTFLVAIERAATWQPQRPLQPWLLGILHREAKVQRRRGRRQVDEQRLAGRAEVAPPQAVLDAEARHEVMQALGGVPMPYREVVELHLVQALAPAAIAERLQRSPGAVRTQLWRGLERLRELLPKGLAVGLVAALPAKAPLAAVRARVVAAAAKAAVPGAFVVAGGVLMQKVLAGIALLFVAGMAWWLLLPPATLPAASDSSGGATADIVASAASDQERRDAAAMVPRQDAGALAAAVVAAKPSLPGPRPVELPVLVVDGGGVPVPDATVEVFEAATPQMPDGRPITPQNRDGTVRRAQLRTDVRGRVILRLARSCIVSASKAEGGWSGDRLVRLHEQVLPDELQLMLRPTGTIRGVVTQADGTLATGALVRGFTQDGDPEFAQWLPGVTTDDAGRFSLQVLAGPQEYWLLASNGGAANRAQAVRVGAGQVVDVALQFLGAFRIRCRVLDADGAAVAARVLLHGEPSNPMDGRDWSGESDAAGRAEFLVDAVGEFDLVAGVGGLTPAELRVTLDTQHPQADVTLRLPPLAEVSGRVVDEQGTGVAGRAVSLVPEHDAASAVVAAMRGRIAGGIEQPVTMADGTFRARLPAAWRYRAMVEAIVGNRELWSRSELFVAPANGVTVVVRTADAQGFVLAGRIVAAATGEPVATASIERIDQEGGASGAMPVGRAAKGTFRVGPCPTGRRCRFTFEAEGFAPAEIGPFDSSVRTEQVVVSMVKCGTVRCRVLHADGRVAAGAFVSLQRDVENPFGRAWQGTTDREGRIEFRDVEPRSFTVHASVLRGREPVTTADVRVQPEQTRDVLITLPR